MARLLADPRLREQLGHAGQRLERYLARTVVPRFEAVGQAPQPGLSSAGALPAGLGEGPTR